MHGAFLNRPNYVPSPSHLQSSSGLPLSPFLRFVSISPSLPSFSLPSRCLHFLPFPLFFLSPHASPPSPAPYPCFPLLSPPVTPVYLQVEREGNVSSLLSFSAVPSHRLPRDVKAEGAHKTWIQTYFSRGLLGFFVTGKQTWTRCSSLWPERRVVVAEYE